MTQQTFEKAKLIDERIKQLEKDLDFVDTVWKEFNNREKVKQLAEYTDHLIRHNIEELKQRFENL